MAVEKERRFIAWAALIAFLAIAGVRLNSGAATASAGLPTGAGGAAATPSTVEENKGPLKVFGGFGPSQIVVSSTDEVVSTSLSTIYNSGDQPVTITGYSPIEASGVEVVGVKFAYENDAAFKPYVGQKGFPDPAALLQPDTKVFTLEDLGVVVPRYKVLTAKPAPNTALWVIVGYRLKAGATKGTVGGVTLHYSYGGTTDTLALRTATILCKDSCS